MSAVSTRFTPRSMARSSKDDAVLSSIAPTPCQSAPKFIVPKDSAETLSPERPSARSSTRRLYHRAATSGLTDAATRSIMTAMKPAGGDQVSWKQRMRHPRMLRALAGGVAAGLALAAVGWYAIIRPDQALVQKRYESTL